MLIDLPTYGEAFIHLATAALILLAFGFPLYLVVGALANKLHLLGSVLLSRLRSRYAR